MGAQPAFPPGVVVAIKALACELPHERGLPLSRLSVTDIRKEAVRRGIVASIGDTTLRRWLTEDAGEPKTTSRYYASSSQATQFRWIARIRALRFLRFVS